MPPGSSELPTAAKASAYCVTSLALAKRASALAQRAKAEANCDAGFMALSAAALRFAVNFYPPRHQLLALSIAGRNHGDLC